VSQEQSRILVPENIREFLDLIIFQQNNAPTVFFGQPSVPHETVTPLREAAGVVGSSSEASNHC
jgi:hypothetical protein